MKSWQAIGKSRMPPRRATATRSRPGSRSGITPAAGAKNPHHRGRRSSAADASVKPATQSLDGGGGRFIFDFAAFAPTGDITIELTGRTRTQTCLVEKSILQKFR